MCRQPSDGARYAWISARGPKPQALWLGRLTSLDQRSWSLFASVASIPSVPLWWYLDTCSIGWLGQTKQPLNRVGLEWLNLETTFTGKQQTSLLTAFLQRAEKHFAQWHLIPMKSVWTRPCCALCRPSSWDHDANLDHFSFSGMANEASRNQG